MNKTNIMKILCAVWILFFHNRIHFGFSMSSVLLNRFVSIGAVACTIFFITSGYGLRRQYRKIAWGG